MTKYSSFNHPTFFTGYSLQYLDSFDPRVTNEFATAAFRFGHSLIPSRFARVSSTPNTRGSRTENLVTNTIFMKDMFFKPQIVMKNPGKENSCLVSNKR